MLNQGGHKPGKHEKPGKLREFEKLSKSQGKLREFQKLSKSQGELKEFEKLSKISGKTQGNFEFLQKNLENSGKM